jgi:hypothetical protein
VGEQFQQWSVAVGATFEIPADSEPGVVELGRYSINVTHDLVTERKK